MTSFVCILCSLPCHCTTSVSYDHHLLVSSLKTFWIRRRYSPLWLCLSRTIRIRLASTDMAGKTVCLKNMQWLLNYWLSFHNYTISSCCLWSQSPTSCWWSRKAECTGIGYGRCWTQYLWRKGPVVFICPSSRCSSQQSACLHYWACLSRLYRETWW